MAQTGRQGINPWMGKPIPKDRIVRAIEESESMHKAAQSLHTSYNTFKKYAKLYDVWKPRPSSAGISRTRKVTWSGLKPLDVEIICYNCYFLEHPNKHKTINKEIGRTFEEQQDINESDITGDELAKELGESLSELFGKN